VATATNARDTVISERSSGLGLAGLGGANSRCAQSGQTGHRPCNHGRKSFRTSTTPRTRVTMPSVSTRIRVSPSVTAAWIAYSALRMFAISGSRSGRRRRRAQPRPPSTESPAPVCAGTLACTGCAAAVSNCRDPRHHHHRRTRPQRLSFVVNALRERFGPARAAGFSSSRRPRRRPAVPSDPGSR
jgi:hypothetical protein